MRWTTGLILAISVVSAGLLFDRASRRQVSNDFASVYFAARAVHQGANPYDLSVLQTLASQASYRGEVFPYLYPPPVAVAMQPVAQLSYDTAARVWFWINFSCVLLAMWWLAIAIFR